uniref:Protein Churchill n=1 Tax=Amorphochlora amoebiformis TaxID=1561963 RepID=A0A7S0DB84_9EUKA
MGEKAGMRRKIYGGRNGNDCLKEFRPERHRTCLDTGAYLLNFKGCCKCGNRVALKMVSRKVEEEEDKDGYISEVVTFNHICAKCSHVICEHYYSFEAGEDAQEYLMECPLCGRGAHTSLFDRAAEAASVHNSEGQEVESKQPLEECKGELLSLQVGSLRQALQEVEGSDNEDDDWED